MELGSADLLQRTMSQSRSMADVLDIVRTGQALEALAAPELDGLWR